MKKTKINVKLENIPPQLHPLFEKAKVYDSSCSPDAQVLFSDLGYYVKIMEKGKLKKEAEITTMFAQQGLGVDVVTYLSEEKDYLVTKAAKGEDATHYLDNPERLCEVLAETMKYLHSRPIENMPVSPCMEQYVALEKEKYLKQDTLIHGDFCLPNIMLDNWKFNSFIDVGLAGLGDKHIDIYWALWSLQYNLKTDKYRDYFLDLYGRDNLDNDILELVAEIESQS